MKVKRQRKSETVVEAEPVVKDNGHISFLTANLPKIIGSKMKINHIYDNKYRVNWYSYDLGKIVHSVWVSVVGEGDGLELVYPDK